MPKVSVLMPVYNAERYLQEAIDSIINQTFTDWELIIINDGSTDGSETIIKAYTDKRIRLVNNEQNLKLIKTLNNGIDLCQGEYIARMDADDIAMPDRLQIQVDFMDKHPDYIMSGTNAIVIDNKGDKTGIIRNLSDSDLLKINLLFSDPFIHPSMLIRRQILASNRFNEDYKHVEDYELWCRISSSGEITNIGQDLLKYRWHDCNVSVLHSAEQDRLKNRIIREQLQSLNIEPTENELYSHKITFQLYSRGKRQEITADKFEEIEQWFYKLSKQNIVTKKYKISDFTAFLWSRWIVLCISQKKIGKLFFPKFAAYNIFTLITTGKLIYCLSKKR